ncbi:unnamed protein product [Adineta ricciae]|uniref:BURP domain-containing protein n=1 Tax=Adineta ricciae TaxID=249248 RepID=A0A815XX75_ADIRI|nr:unnamed protein product [Adineta ricciae]
MKLILIIACVIILKHSNGLTNPNSRYNWRWIAYPRALTAANDQQSADEEKTRVRRNPNWGYQPNWRWISYPRALTAANDQQSADDEAIVRRSHINKPGKAEGHGQHHHHHSRPKPYESERENSNKPFNRSLYQGWYQLPSSLAVNNTLLMGGSWGNVEKTNINDESINTCDISNISICNIVNNVEGEVRQCFHQIDEITSYASEFFNVSNDNIAIYREDEKLAELPFPEPFNVTISEVVQIVGCDGNPLVCHTMKANASDCNTLYLCHAVHGTVVKQVTVDYNEELNNVTMYAMCHLKTDNFGKEHVAFRMLHKRPGDGICHFISPDSFLVCKN